jgi:phosphate acetyltransferase
MRKKLYLTGIEKRSGKSFVSLGLLSALKEQQSSVHCYKLFAESDAESLLLLEDIAGHPIPTLMNIKEAIGLMRSHPEDLMSSVLDNTQPIDRHVLNYYEGSDFESDNDVFEFQFNLTLAYQLNCDVILHISAKDRTLEHTLSVLNTALDISKQKHTHVVGVIVNRVPAALETAAQELFNTNLPHLPFIVILPEFDTLANPSMLDISRHLHATVLYGDKELHRPVRQLTVAAKTVGNFLQSRMDREGMLIITPDDRVDILLGSLLADQSSNYPKIAGLVLTGGEQPPEGICEIIAGLEYSFPILLTDLKTYETATALYSAKFSLTLAEPQKVMIALDTMRPFLLKPLLQFLSQKTESIPLSPAMFLYELVLKAKQKKQHIVLPEGYDVRVLQAADYLLQRHIVDITLLGKPEKIHLLAKRHGLSLLGVQIIDIDKSPDKEPYAERYYELRKHKNVNLPISLERMTDGNYFAVMMVHCGDANGMVSGATHTTADTVRPALEIIKTKPGIQKVSSIFIMCLPSRVLIYGDCAINPEPDSHTLADIANQAAEIAQSLGIDPKVALLSYSSGDSGKGSSVEKVAQAYEMIKKAHPKLMVEGPIQYDAAVDPEVAAKKLPHSSLAGRANVLIFPDLNTGNNTYKAVQRESGALAIGPVLLGLNKPVNDLSRGCTPQDIINTILVTAIQAQGSAQ